jgi:hypothetical protein
MSSFLNRFLQELLTPTPDISLIILFCNVNTRHILVEFPQMIIPYIIIEWKYMKYTVIRTSIFSVWNNLLNTKHAASNLGRIWSTWFFQFRWLLICTPRNFVLIVSSMSIFAYSIANGACNEFLGVNFTDFVFSIFKTNSLAWNHLFV